MSFPTEFLSGATCNGTHKANITAVMTSTWLNSDHKVTQTEGTHTHVMTKKGNQGVNTYAHDMLEFRQLFQNIVQMIIHDSRIAELFMLVY